MVHFVIHEDILIYKTKIKKLIENCMINIEYKIEEPNSFSDEPTIYNWIQKEKFLTASKKAEKYDKIVKITKE